MRAWFAEPCDLRVGMLTGSPSGVYVVDQEPAGAAAHLELPETASYGTPA